VLPRFIDLAMRNKDAARLRSTWIPQAGGEVLEIIFLSSSTAFCGSDFGLTFTNGDLLRLFDSAPFSPH